MSEMHASGITPYMLKLANYYAMLGVGEYTPAGSPYAKIIVRVKNPWQQNDENLALSMSILSVQFVYASSGIVREIEFCVMLGGWSGPPLLRKVESPG